MSQLVKTKRQANFKDFKRFGAFKGFVEEKNVVRLASKKKRELSEKVLSDFIQFF
jgi:hypothetical protein